METLKTKKKQVPKAESDAGARKGKTKLKPSEVAQEDAAKAKTSRKKTSATKSKVAKSATAKKDEVQNVVGEARPVRRSKAEGTWGCYPKSISRIETIKHSAWYVRIYFQGAYVRKTFSDNVYGGKDVAFHEALKWRDEMERLMGKPRTDRSVRKKILSDNRVAGIHRRRLKDSKRGKTYYRDVYEVTWAPEPGKVWRTTVSVTKHGEEEAYRKALEVRREKERKYFGGTIS